MDLSTVQRRPVDGPSFITLLDRLDGLRFLAGCLKGSLMFLVQGRLFQDRTHGAAPFKMNVVLDQL